MRVYFLVSYSDQGLQGLMKSNYAERRAQIEKLCSNVGGKLAWMRYLHGPYDVLAEAEFDSYETAAGIVTAMRLSGAMKDILVMSEFDVDKAIQSAGKAGYRPPGA